MWLYFRGWKRKIGLVALVLACSFSMLWIRSFTSTDVTRWSLQKFDFVSLSADSTIAVGFRYLFNTPIQLSCPKLDSNDFAPFERKFQEGWFQRYCGIFQYHIAAEPVLGDLTCVIAISYAWIVFPLILISALCLLTKQRFKPAPKSESAHA
jgi:hypothetical protein